MNKLEAARQQLVTAINLHLLDVDPVSVHALGNNALALLKGVLAEEGQKSLTEFMSSHPALFGEELPDHRVFLAGEKEADIEIEETSNDALLFMACADFQSAAEKTELDIQLFGQWFLSVHQDNVRDASFEQFPDAVREKFFPPDFADQPRVMQKQTGHAIIVHMHDEMQKTVAEQAAKGEEIE